MSQIESGKEAAPPARGGIAAPAAPTAKLESNDKGGGVFSFGGFRTLFAGSLSGTLADRMYQMSLIAAANLIFVGAETERNATRVQIFATIPGVLLYAAASSMIDTFDRRRLMTVIEGIKIFLVLALVPPLWNSVYLEGNAEMAAQMRHYWPFCLAIVVLLNVINVPFAPARAAAIPDVVPERHRSIGASLMATTGLISLLVGSALGGVLARSDVLGPARMVILASILFAIATMLFKLLPAAVAVPGNRRGEIPAPTEKLTAGEYVRSILSGFTYCFSHMSVLGLTFFETAFWTIASLFYVLFQVHLRTVLQLNADDKIMFFGIGLGCAGIGLFGGAVGIGKICRKVSPIVTYAPAFLLVGIGVFGVFASRLVGADGHVIPPELLGTPVVVGHVPTWLYPVMFSLGLGGGLLLGRIDADVLATVQEDIRGRVFSFKAMAFAIVTLATMVCISELLTPESIDVVKLWLPRAVFLIAPIAFAFSWVIDVAIWAKRGDPELPGAIHRFGYRIVRVTGWTIFKILFRYEIKGEENVPRSGPVVLAANHAAFIDPFLVGCGTSRLVQYIIYSSYYRSLAHPIFRFLRCIPVDEKDHLAALKASVRSLSQGACICIFPEGRVSADGKLQPPQRGALFLAQRAGATVVPVALKGNHAAWPRQRWLPRLSKITVIYGKPFSVPKELSKKDTAELTDKLMSDLAGMLGLEPPPKAAEKEAKV
jgi:1-acyl-sn-glycerol-3-phosphate acyltransferase